VKNSWKSWLIRLATGTKRKNNEIGKGYLLDMNDVNTMEYLSIIPLGSYDILIGMDWLDVHHVVLYFYKILLLFLMKKENKG